MSELFRPLQGNLLLALLVALLSTQPRCTAEEFATPEEIEQLLPQHLGAAVLAVDRGEVVFKHAWGKRHLDQDAPCTQSTNFRLASVSKQFTAASVLKLADQGALLLDDTLDTFFTGGPDFWGEVTVHHLLMHTSGVPDYESIIPEGTELQLSDQNILAMLIDCEEPAFEPGSRFAYSNSGYVLLGLIVEQVAHQPFHDFLANKVFAPAGMSRSVLYVKGRNRVSERAFGHSLEKGDNWIVADQSITSAARGDGGVYSSLDDLQAWIAALNGGNVLSQRLHKTMFTPHVITPRNGQSYGYGWFLDEHHGEPRAMHGGGTRGFCTMLQWFPERRAGVVILLNRSPGDDTKDYADKVVDRLLFNEIAD